MLIMADRQVQKSDFCTSRQKKRERERERGVEHTLKKKRLKDRQIIRNSRRFRREVYKFGIRVIPATHEPYEIRIQ